MKQPSNQACLAVELYAAAPKSANVTPFGAARVAAQLCALGRRHKRASEHVCSYPDPEERAARCRSRAHDAMLELLKPWGKRARLEIDGGGLCFHVVTVQGSQDTNKTWLGAP
jgi:hypothetical protein